MEMLGEGAFGEVWKAMLKMPIAQAAAASQGDIQEEEVLIMFFAQKVMPLVLFPVSRKQIMITS